MFANFTEETCTGTGGTLALAGATAGNIQFSKSFSDGDLVSYALSDSGGVIKVAGIGIYVSATDDITRNDTWNWNGTVVDKNPATNIALSGGTHTVTASVTAQDLISNSGNAKTSETILMNGLLTSASGGEARTLEADTQLAYAFRLMEPADVASFGITVLTLDAAGSAEIGLTRCIDGVPEDTYIVSGAIDITTTGAKTVAVNKVLPAGYYFCHLVTDSAIAAFNSADSIYYSGAATWTPLRKTLYSNRTTPCFRLNKNGVTLGTLDADPSTVTSNSVSTTTDYAMIWVLNRTS